MSEKIIILIAQKYKDFLQLYKLYLIEKLQNWPHSFQGALKSTSQLLSVVWLYKICKMVDCIF